MELKNSFIKEDQNLGLKLNKIIKYIKWQKELKEHIEKIITRRSIQQLDFQENQRQKGKRKERISANQSYLVHEYRQQLNKGQDSDYIGNVYPKAQNILQAQHMAKSQHHLYPVIRQMSGNIMLRNNQYNKLVMNAHKHIVWKVKRIKQLLQCYLSEEGRVELNNCRGISVKVGEPELQCRILVDLVKHPFSLQATRREFRRFVEDNDQLAQKEIIHNINQEINAILQPLLSQYQYQVKLNTLSISFYQFKQLLNNYVQQEDN